jgi:GTP-binding protein
MPDIRNIAIIAHVDHGKTTLVDQILRQSNFFQEDETAPDCFMDSDALERERGITILAKNVSIRYRDTKINILDTPGHSDFGGQVERVLRLADGVLLLVDAEEGPMPQTRFVLDKALKLGLTPIVVLNKMDRPAVQPATVHDKVLELFFDLGATNAQLDFPTFYASSRQGWADARLDGPRHSILPLLDAILQHIPAPAVVPGPVQMQIATLDYSDYLGRIGIGRVYRGDLEAHRPLVRLDRGGRASAPAPLKQIFTFDGIERVPADRIPCGDLCAIAGLEEMDIGDTLADPECPEALPGIRVDEPTLAMVFRVNDSPLGGQEGAYSSNRHLRERLFKEPQRDVALRVEAAGEAFKVSGRGVLHLSVLMENMRREGYEMTVTQPQVIMKTVGGTLCEPLEELTVEVPEAMVGKVIEQVGLRRGEMVRMEPRGARRLLDFHIPTRGLIGLRTRITTATAGEAVIAHRFLHYVPHKGPIPHRITGVLVSMENGPAVAYAIDALQQRGTFFISPGEVAYEGMIVGENTRSEDMVVNVQRAKKLTNMRTAGKDRNIDVTPARQLSLEDALEFIAADEMLEVTPKSIRLRKAHLKEYERKRIRRMAEA